MKELDHDMITKYLQSGKELPVDAYEGKVHISHAILKATHPYELLQTMDNIWELLNQCAVFCNTDNNDEEVAEK